MTTLSDRKRDHLRICLEEDVRSTRTTGLERYRLLHNALPGISLDEVDLQTTFLGHALGAPLLVSSMTGGTPDAMQINRNLASVAEEFGLALALGSIRVALEQPALWNTFRVRDVAPHALLLANLGAIQLSHGMTSTEILDALHIVGADALVLHLNPLQEALQEGGDTDFRGVSDRIAALCSTLPVPVIVKEVGSGLSVSVARCLWEAGVSALDVAGTGGTSWSEVERLRAADEDAEKVARAFADWGISTAQAVAAVHSEWPDRPIIASGGVRDGVDIAKCLCLGASVAGMAQGLLSAAATSADALKRRVGVVLRQLRIAMFCVGAASPREMNASRLTLDDWRRA